MGIRDIHCLYVGTREYLGIIDEQQDHIVTSIPVVSDKGEKDTIDAYITGICENEDSIYAVSYTHLWRKLRIGACRL